MPYILFNTHHWQRATSQKARETASLHNLSGYTSNHSSVSEGQHAARLIHADRDETESFVSVLAYFCYAVWTETVIPSDAHTMSLSSLQTSWLADSSLYKMDINHLVWFQSISVHFFFVSFFEKTQWTKWIASLWEQAAGNCTCLSAMLQLFSGSVSLLFSFFSVHVSTPSNLKTNIQWPSNAPVHSCSHQNTKAWQQTESKILQKPQIWGLNFFQMWKLKCKNILFPISSPADFLPTRSFSFHFLHRPSYVRSFSSTGLLSVSCHRQSSTRVNTVKFTWCPVGMWICESSRSSLFLFFSSIFFFLKSMRTLAAAG